MEQIERLTLIRQLIESGAEIDALSVMDVLSVDTVTLAGDFRFLINEWEILQVKPWVYQKRFDVRKYLNQEIYQREKKYYNSGFLENYIPNKTNLWTDEEKKKLIDLQADKVFSFNYTQNLRGIENFLYDQVEFCSKLDDCSYGRLDIEIFLRHGVRKKWTPFNQSKYLENLKQSFEYVRDTYEDSFLVLHDFETASRRICDKKVSDAELGKLRSYVLELQDIAYVPLSDNNILEKQYELSLEKLKKIEDPFEKMLFILVYISYILPFSDGNKELTYYMCNIPLLKAWYTPFVFFDTDFDEFEIAYKALYELCDTIILKELILDIYTKNISRYTER